MSNQVVSIRPAQLEFSPQFVPSVQSSPSNIYVSKIAAQTNDERRMSFVWRSPSSQLLMSPLAEIVFQVKVTAPYKLDRENQVGTLLGCFDTQHEADGVQVGADQVAHTHRKGYGYRPLLCFGEGNCGMQAVESMSISINGAVWSELSANLYARSLDRCFVPDDVAQRRYSTCGGRPNSYDSKPVSGSVLGLPDTIAMVAIANNRRAVEALEPVGGESIVAGSRAIEGLTVDSGLAQRQHNFYDQVVENGTLDANSHTITLQIKGPDTRRSI